LESKHAELAEKMRWMEKALYQKMLYVERVLDDYRYETQQRRYKVGRG